MGIDLGYPIGFIAKIEFVENKLGSLPTETLLGLISHVSKQKLLTWENKKRIFELVEVEFKSRLPEIKSDELLSLFHDKRFRRKHLYGGFDLRDVMAKEIISRTNIDSSVKRKLYEKEEDWRVLEKIGKEVGKNNNISVNSLIIILESKRFSDNAYLELLSGIVQRDDIRSDLLLNLYSSRYSKEMRSLIASTIVGKSGITWKEIKRMEEGIFEANVERTAQALRRLGR